MMSYYNKNINKVVISVGIKRNVFPYVVWKMVKWFDSYQFVFLDKLYCSDISIAKAGVVNRTNKETVIVVETTSGVKYYYHPRFKKWYKNLSNEMLDKYFDWLNPNMKG